MATAQDVLAVAESQLGYKESPAGSNRTKYGKWFRMDGQPWCMMFVQWVFDQAGAVYLLPIKTASCGTLMRAAKNARRWVTKDYQPGDVVIYDFPGGAETDHCGIVVSASGSEIVAIEGNTGAQSDANGGQVQRRTRSVNVVLGAFRPVYEEDEMDWSKITAADVAKMPDEAVDALLGRIQTRQGGKGVSKVLQAEIDVAVALGITDGSSPQALCTRAQAAVMAKRAAECK